MRLTLMGALAYRAVTVAKALQQLGVESSPLYSSKQNNWK